jgi:outer membrane protein insertion porin family
MLWVTLAAALAVTAPPVVSSLTVEGNVRTREAVIRDELTVKPGDRYVPARWAADEQAVKDLGIFWSTAATAAVRDGRADLVLRVREKWTLLPIVQYARIRDAYQLTVGVWDANLLGYGMEGGVKLIRKKAGTSYDVWLFQPRVAGGPLYFRIESLAGERSLYDYARTGGDGDLTARFAESRAGVELELGRRLDSTGERRLGLYYGPYTTRYAGEGAAGQPAPRARVAHRLGLKAVLGRVHYDDYVYTGSRLDAAAYETIPLDADTSAFARWEAQLRRFWVPAPRHNVALRAVAGGTGSLRFEDAFFMGGLDEVRGYPDQRFHGRYAVYADMEYRYPAVDNRWVLVQAVALSDGGAVWDGAAAGRRPQAAWAAGAGLHALVKPVQRLVVRLDLVRSLAPFPRNEFSLGFKEFIDAAP